MRQTTDTRHLPVKLTEEELAAKAQELADSVREEEEEREAFAAWESTMKEAAKAKKAKIYIAHQETVDLGEIVESGLETREVRCSWLYTASTAFLRRDDTGELVHVRDLREDEKQATLPGTGGEVVQEPALLDLLNWSVAGGAVFDTTPEDIDEIRFPDGTERRTDESDLPALAEKFIRENFKG